MNTQPIIMFPLFDHQWTLTALHEACQLALAKSAKIILLQMIPVQHLSWLGTEWGGLNFTMKMQRQLRDYQRTVEGYGVDFEVKLFQYENLNAGIIQAAEGIGADVVFTKTSKHRLPLRSRWMKWQLGLQHRQLCEVPA